MSKKPPAVDGKAETQALFHQLQTAIQGEEFDKCVKLANKILHFDPKNTKAFQCKIVSLINDGKYTDVVSLLSKVDDTFQELCAFEKAYCYYRLNQNENSLGALEKMPQDPKSSELKAQLYFRLERYSESVAIYKELLRSSHDACDEERLGNLIAAVALSGESVEESTNTYEQAFNTACCNIATKRYGDAEKALATAERVYEASDDQDETTRAAITTQKGYLAQLKGDESAALAAYTQVIKERPDDAGILSVASNNIVTINRDQNVFDSKKRMKSCFSDASKSKLTSAQFAVVLYNQTLLNVVSTPDPSRMSAACQPLLTQAEASHPAEFQVGHWLLLRAYILHVLKRGKEGIALLKNANVAANDAAALRLALAQLYLQTGGVSEGTAAVLEAARESKYPLALVAFVVSLYGKTSANDKVAAWWDEVLTAWEHRDETQYELLLRAASSSLLQLNNGAAAAQVLEKLHARHPNEMRFTAQLLSIYRKIDNARAQKISKALPSLDEQAEKLDVAALERTTLGPRAFTKKAGETPILTVSDERKKRKKKRKPIPPKNYNPKAQPDPERWLPRKERSTYRPRRGEKKRDQFKGAQGAAADHTTTESLMGQQQTKTPEGNVKPPPNVKQNQPNRKKKGRR